MGARTDWKISAVELSLRGVGCASEAHQELGERRRLTGEQASLAERLHRGDSPGVLQLMGSNRALKWRSVGGSSTIR
jgi:hypothetical protein